jgi:hypothetical protein
MERRQLLECRFYPWDEEKLRPFQDVVPGPAAVYYAIAVKENGGAWQAQPFFRKLHSQQGETPQTFSKV